MFLLAIPVEVSDSDILSVHQSLIEQMKVFRYIKVVESVTGLKHPNPMNVHDFDTHTIRLSLVDDMPRKPKCLLDHIRSVKFPCIIIETSDDYEKTVEAQAAIFSMSVHMEGFAFFKIESVITTTLNRYLWNVKILSFHKTFDSVIKRLRLGTAGPLL